MAKTTELTISFPGGKKVDAALGAHVVHTDQPVAGGGEDSAPAPFSLFLASIGTCAGIYVLGFCQNRNLPTEGLRILQRAQFNAETGVLERVELDIQVPPGFPEKYHDALVRVADQCAVKKAIQAMPQFSVRAVPAKAAE
jgi:ribosomal protein S12 methylthiotransferase accessory factor